MNDAKIHKAASIVIICAGVGLLAYFALDNIIAAILPFAIAWSVAQSLRPLSRKISSLTRINERAVRLVLAMLSSALFISVVVGVLWYIVNKTWQFLSGIDANNEIVSAVTSFFKGGFFSKIIFGEEFSEYLKTALGSVSASLMKKLGEVVSSVATALPTVFIFMIVTIISAAYFAFDLEGINGAVKSVLPKRAALFLQGMRGAFKSVGVRYIRSYLIILSVTFITLFLGFLLIGVEYAALIALFVALLDILPVFGVGTVLLPWGVVAFIIGEVGEGVGILLLFGFITVLREIVEPKILGKNLGLHPLVTLVLLYLGYSFFGFLGMVLLPPIGALVCVMLRRETSGKS